MGDAAPGRNRVKDGKRVTEKKNQAGGTGATGLKNTLRTSQLSDGRG